MTRSTTPPAPGDEPANELPHSGPSQPGSDFLLPMFRDTPHGKRIQELFAERTKAMSTWGVAYWSLGPEHPFTVQQRRIIIVAGDRIRLLMSEGTK